MRKIFKILRKICTFERKTGKTGTFYDFGTISQHSLVFAWHFKPIPLCKIFSQKIWPAQKNKFLEGLICERKKNLNSPI